MAQSGNGIDIGTIYELLTRMSARMDAMSARMDTMSEQLSQLTTVVNDHTRQLDDLQASVTNLRGDVQHYHEAVVSQGIHYSELEGRMLRVERHLKLEPGE